MNLWEEFLKVANFNNEIINTAQLTNIEVFEEDKMFFYITLHDVVPIKILDEFIRRVKNFKIENAKITPIIKFSNIENLQTLHKEYYDRFFEMQKKESCAYDFLKEYDYKYDSLKKTYSIIIDKGSKFVNNIIDEIAPVVKKYFPQLKIRTIIDFSLESLANKITNEAKIEQETGLKQQKITEESTFVEKKRTSFTSKKIKGNSVAINKIPLDLYQLDKYRAENGEPKFIVQGEIYNLEIRKLTNTTLMQFILRDNTDAIVCKQFLKTQQEINEAKVFKIGDYVELSASAVNDTYIGDIVLMVNAINLIDKPLVHSRLDSATKKRVELGAHTKMSTLDSVLEIEELFNQASLWKHSAVGITDTNNLWSYPVLSKFYKKYKVKPIYGVEFNLTDNQKFIIANNVDLLKGQTYTVFDVETTGLSHHYDELIEIGAVKFRDGLLVDKFSKLIKIDKKLRKVIINTTNISDDDLSKNGIDIKDALKEFTKFIGDSILVAHNAQFDINFLNQALKKHQINKTYNQYIDTLRLAQFLYSDRLKRFNLKALTKELKVELTDHHRAFNDAEATGHCFIKMLLELKSRGITSLKDYTIYNEGYKYLIPNKISMLVKNEVGYRNLFKLLTYGLTDYFYKEPRLTKELVNKFRDGLFIGSSAEEGEIFEEAFYGLEEKLEARLNFYDYIEIFPPEGYLHLAHELEDTNLDIIKDVITRIIKLAKKHNKLVIATSHPRYINIEDKPLYEVYVNAKRVGGGVSRLSKYEVLPNNYYMTTTEMLSAFSFLDPLLAEEIVITNPNLISAQIEEIKPFPDELFSLTDDAFATSLQIASIDDELRKLIKNKLDSLYGSNLNEIITKRVNTELKTIIKNKYGPIYYIAYLLVSKSLNDGYIVGSRGSVGSSFVATLIDVTEVNPLAPHYLCPNCKFHYFAKDDKEVLDNEKQLQKNFNNIYSGFDLPEANCPKCGTKLKGDGQNIPFETFLGFSGDKIPDIDLNFSGEYQASAHSYVRELLGDDYTFRAGTVTKIKEQNAFGLLKGYLAQKKINYRKAYMNIIAKKLENVQQTTSQHPGGIVIVPANHSILEITPVQYPSNDTGSSWLTTHFDYHSFEANLLKLDILGHDDPTMIKYFMDYVSLNPNEFSFNNPFDIPLVDKKVLSLFSTTKELGISASELGSPVGTYGISEFGTAFVRGVLKDTMPRTFSDLVRISGVTHGTNIWINNEDLLVTGKTKYGKIPFNKLIGCRDDIMTTLIHEFNMEPQIAFNIMEFIRKNKIKEKPSEWLNYEKILKEHKLPEWYIESASKIEYLFPKAHAVAYVLSALRIAWFKVYKPLLFYSAFFSKRATQFNYEACIKGKDAIKEELTKLNAISKPNPLQKAMIKFLELALEMILRGFKFYPVDMKKSSATEFIIEENGLRMPFITIDLLGDIVAKEIVKARQEKPFTSLEDIKKRSSINKTTFEKMKKLGIFNDYVASSNDDENPTSVGKTLFDFF